MLRRQLLRRQGRAKVGIPIAHERHRQRTNLVRQPMVAGFAAVPRQQMNGAVLFDTAQQSKHLTSPQAISAHASATRSRPDCTPSSTSSRTNSCLLIDTAAMAHLPRPQNQRECHLYLAEGCHLYIAATIKCRPLGVMVSRTADAGSRHRGAAPTEGGSPRPMSSNSTA